MSAWQETHKSFINSWECDENAHMNIQFYWKRFGDAAPIFFHLSRTDRQNWSDRHVRYHRELMMGTNTIVKSARGVGKNQLIHQLLDGDTSTVSATAIDRYDKVVGGEYELIDSVPDIALPRSLPAEPLQPIETDRVIQQGTGLVSNRSIITPMECNHMGNLLDQYHIARFSDAASHLWHHLGVTRDWMRQNTLGSVAVEMKTSRHAEAQVGMMIEVVTWLEQLRAKTFTFRHQISDMETRKPLYSGAVTALLMDLNSRRAVELPTFMGKQLQS